MKLTKLIFGFAALSLVACAGNQQAVERSVGQAEGFKTLSQESKMDSAAMSVATADLDSAKAYQQAGEEEKAIELADKSTLEYKITLLAAERDELKKEDARVEKELRSDVERRLLYQNILEQETKGAK